MKWKQYNIIPQLTGLGDCFQKNKRIAAWINMAIYVTGLFFLLYDYIHLEKELKTVLQL